MLIELMVLMTKKKDLSLIRIIFFWICMPNQLQGRVNGVKSAAASLFTRQELYVMTLTGEVNLIPIWLLKIWSSMKCMSGDLQRMRPQV